MAYVRKKKTKGREYYQLVEGRRENGKVRQKVLVHLGDCPSVEKALKWWPGRILRMWHVAGPIRKDAEGTREIMARDLTDKDEGYREFALRFLDENGNMRRRKYAPHELKEAYFRPEVLGDDYYSYLASLGAVWERRHDLFTRWQYEYWRKMDRVAQLERKASDLEERYVKLYAINGGDPDEARRLLRERFEHLLEGHKRRARWHEARYEERRRAMGEGILGEIAKTNPVLALQATLHGYSISDE